MPSLSVLRDAPLLFKSRAYREVVRLAERVAACEDFRVSVLGESGVGKSLIARLIHDRSSRASRPFRAFSCGAVSPALCLSQLFGHVKGAFTDATADSPGLLRSAQGGSFVFDDIDKFPRDLQDKLLGFLDHGVVAPVGSMKEVPVDVRTILTSNRDLETMAREGTFLADLFNRIDGVRIMIPPLRERPEDIPVTAKYFLDRVAKGAGIETPRISRNGMDFLRTQAWPGNVRQLVTVLERVMVTGAKVINERILARCLSDASGGRVWPSDAEIKSLRSLPPAIRTSKPVITSVMRMTGGNGAEAARVLSIHERTFRNYVDKHGLTRKRRRGVPVE